MKPLGERFWELADRKKVTMTLFFVLVSPSDTQGSTAQQNNKKPAHRSLFSEDTPVE